MKPCIDSTMFWHKNKNSVFLSFLLDVPTQLMLIFLVQMCIKGTPRSFLTNEQSWRHVFQLMFYEVINYLFFYWIIMFRIGTNLVLGSNLLRWWKDWGTIVVSSPENHWQWLTLTSFIVWKKVESRALFL